MAENNEVVVGPGRPKLKFKRVPVGLHQGLLRKVKIEAAMQGRTTPEQLDVIVAKYFSEKERSK